jgi:hypothetical protein
LLSSMTLIVSFEGSLSLLGVELFPNDKVFKLVKLELPPVLKDWIGLVLKLMLSSKFPVFWVTGC